MTIGERIKEKRIEAGLSADYVADKLNKNRATIFRYESNKIKDVPITIIQELAKILHTTPEYLMGWGTTDNKEISNISSISVQRIPLLGAISCGEPKFAAEDRESYVEAGTEIKADFCLRAKGDSMINARIYDGDIVFIRKQSIVENGDIAAVVVNNDNEATLKRFFYYREKALLVLKAENPEYKDLEFSDEELNNVHVLGKAVAFQSDVK